MPYDAGEETDNEIEYRYVRGQGWVASLKKSDRELSVVAGYFYSPGDIFRDGSGNYYSVVSVQGNSITVRITNPIRYVSLTGTVEI